MNPKAAYGAAKPQMHLIPPVAKIEMAAVLRLGADKYGAYNWRNQPVNATTYISAIERHLCLWAAGDDDDHESRASHLAHIMASAAILLDSMYSKTLIDDRLKDDLGGTAYAMRVYTKDTPQIVPAMYGGST